MKYGWTILILAVGYAFMPHGWTESFTKSGEQAIHIKAQVCGCPCPEARIIKGLIDIPEDIELLYPDIHRDQLNLVGKSPFVPFNYDRVYNNYTFRIKGEVVGADTILCYPDECEMVPRFQVDKWVFTSYVPGVLAWQNSFLLGYVLTVLIGLCTLVLLTIIRYLKHRKS